MNALHFSNSELSALVIKAVRGAGFSWGLAQEAGMAVASLSAHGLASAEVLLSYIEGERGATPTVEKNILRGEKLCPLILGAALCDFAKQLNFPLHINVCYPILLLPFLLQTAKILSCGFLLNWQGVKIEIANGIKVKNGDSLLLAKAEVIIKKTNTRPAPATTLQTGQDVASSIYHRLEKLSFETMVPISTTSRTGAGAAGGDND